MFPSEANAELNVGWSLNCFSLIKKSQFSSTLCAGRRLDLQQPTVEVHLTSDLPFFMDTNCSLKLRTGLKAKGRHPPRLHGQTERQTKGAKRVSTAEPGERTHGTEEQFFLVLQVEYFYFPLFLKAFFFLFTTFGTCFVPLTQIRSAFGSKSSVTHTVAVTDCLWSTFIRGKRLFFTVIVSFTKLKYLSELYRKGHETLLKWYKCSTLYSILYRIYIDIYKGLRGGRSWLFRLHY